MKFCNWITGMQFAVLLLGGTHAAAAELTEWTGFSTASQLTYVEGDKYLKATGAGVKLKFNTVNYSGSLDGVRVGYDWNPEGTRWLIGGFASYVSGYVYGQSSRSLEGDTAQLSFAIDGIADLGLRAGYLFTQNHRLLVYGKVAATAINGEVCATGIYQSTKYQECVSGWAFDTFSPGIGAEYRLPILKWAALRAGAEVTWQDISGRKSWVTNGQKIQGELRSEQVAFSAFFGVKFDF